MFFVAFFFFPILIHEFVDLNSNFMGPSVWFRMSIFVFAIFKGKRPAVVSASCAQQQSILKTAQISFNALVRVEVYDYMSPERSTLLKIFFSAPLNPLSLAFEVVKQLLPILVRAFVGVLCDQRNLFAPPPEKTAPDKREKVKEESRNSAAHFVTVRGLKTSCWMPSCLNHPNNCSTVSKTRFNMSLK